MRRFPNALVSDSLDDVTGGIHMQMRLMLASGLAVLLFSQCVCQNATGTKRVSKLTGIVTAGTPVGAADVSVFAIGDDGRRGDTLLASGTVKTDDAGAFVAQLPEDAFGFTGRVQVCARGSYVEPATATVVRLTEDWCAIANIKESGDAVDGVLVTPWTTLHTGLTACFVERGDALEDADVEAAGRLNDFLSADDGVASFDFRSGAPLDVTASPAPAVGADEWHGLLLASLAETAKAIAIASDLEPGIRVTEASLTSVLLEDIDDGGTCKFDGQGRAGGLTIGNVAVTAATLRGAPQGFAGSILRFLESDRNASNIPSEDVVDLAAALAAHTSPIFGEGAAGDLDKPVISFTEPVANSTRGGLVPVSVTVVDASALPTVQFLAPVQAAFIAATPTCTTDETGTTCTLTGSLNTSLAPIVDGPVTISVNATDAAGNSETANLVFTVNNSLPSISVAAPQDLQRIVGVQTITATATDIDGIESLTVDIPGVGLCSSAAGAALPDIEPATGTLSCSWDSTQTQEGDATLTFHAVDGAGQSADLTTVVVVDNRAASTIRGFVDVGSPVAGATVTALDWTGRTRGALLAGTTADEDGAYELVLDDEDHDSILIVATGGTFVDLATGGSFPISEGQELTSAVAAITAGETRDANVNAWTTIAAARALRTPATSDDAFAINSNVTLLSQHIRRIPFGAPFNAASVRSADLTTEVVTISDQRAVLALSHAGLSRLAAEVSVRAGVAVGTVTLVELTRLLARDVSEDPLLDGVGQGELLTVGPRSEPITSLTTRLDLAASLDRWLGEVALVDVNGIPVAGANVDRNNSSITRDDAFNGRLYEAIAEDNRSELYGDVGPPFDTSGPDITLEFSDTAFGQPFGAALTGNVVITGRATDAGGISAFTATIDGVDPFADADNDVDDLRLLITPDVVPNNTDAAAFCADAPEAPDAALLTNAVCACADAVDGNDNASQSLICFTRPAPSPQILQPDPDVRVSGNAPISLVANATSGFAMASCTANLAVVRLDNDGTPDPIAPPLPTPTVSGTSCSFAGSAPAGTLTADTWRLVMTATDVVGQRATATRDFVVDLGGPGIQILQPVPGTISNQPPTVASGSLAASGDIASVTVTVKNGASIIRTVAATLSPPPPLSTSWSATLNLPAIVGDANLTIEALATDTVGNTTQVNAPFIVDRTNPTLTLTATQPTLRNYAADQATSPVGTLTCQATGACIDRREMRPSAAPSILSTSLFASTSNVAATGTPAVRWESMLTSTEDVPRVTVAVSDANAATVSYEVGTSCAAQPSRASAAIQSGSFNIDIVQAASSVTLRNESGANVLCVAIQASDVAGNRSNVISRFFKWRTIAPPPRVTLNTRNFNLTNRGYTLGTGTVVPDVGSFTGAELKTLADTATSVVVAHAHVHNPYSVPMRFNAEYLAGVGGNGTLLDMSIDGPLTHEWTPQADSASLSAPVCHDINGVPCANVTTAQTQASPLRNPCNTVAESGTTSTAAKWPSIVIAGTTNPCDKSAVDATQVARIFTVNNYTYSGNVVVPHASSSLDVNVSQAATTAPTKTNFTGITNLSNLLTQTTTVTVAPAAYLYFSATEAGEPITQLVPDVDGFVTIAPGTTIMVLHRISTLAFAGFGRVIEPTPNDRVVAFTRHNSTHGLPLMQTGPGVFYQAGQSAVFLWARNASGANDATDLQCDANECAVGVTFRRIQTYNFRLPASQSTPRFQIRTAPVGISTAAVLAQWTGSKQTMPDCENCAAGNWREVRAPGF